MVAAADLGDLVYTPPANAHGDDYASFTFKVSDGTSESAAAYTLTIDVTAVNDAATGQPTVSGTARVGQTLTAAKGTVADVDGLTKAANGDSGYAFTWQWYRVDGENESAIADATAKTYALAAADQGKKLKVRLGFTDDDGNEESRTSAETATVAANAAPSAANKTVTTDEDTAYTFAAADFGFRDGDTGTSLRASGSPPCPTPPRAPSSSTTPQWWRSRWSRPPISATWSTPRRPTPTATTTRASPSRSATAPRRAPPPTPSPSTSPP